MEKGIKNTPKLILLLPRFFMVLIFLIMDMNVAVLLT